MQFCIYTSDVLIHAMLWWLVIKDVERQTIYNAGAMFFWGPSTKHWTVPGRTFTDMSDWDTPLISDRNFCPQNIRGFHVVTLQLFGLWFVYVHQYEHQNFLFSLNKEAVFPLGSWHPTIKLLGATCQNIVYALFWDVTQCNVLNTIFKVQEVLALEDGNDMYSRNVGTTLSLYTV